MPEISIIAVLKLPIWRLSRDTTNSDLIAITAGRGQKHSETRTDSTKENAEIFKTIVPEVVTYFSKTLILVATNTVDILSYITYNISGKPSHEVIRANGF
ncbi:hypothetical protein AGMMS49593_05930 [Endomicrobiia bacterium]|nr:hypothetical protein AGMMS49593_05930 [Endomicrobiia bacterium]